MIAWVLIMAVYPGHYVAITGIVSEEECYRLADSIIDGIKRPPPWTRYAGTTCHSYRIASDKSQ